VSDSTCADAYTGHFTHINTCDDGAMGCSKTKIQGTALGVKVVVGTGFSLLVKLVIIS